MKSNRSPGALSRNVSLHRADKREFNVENADDLYTLRVTGWRMPTLPKHVGLARKAALGTLTIPGGRRGLQVRRVDGKLRITT